MAIRCNNLAHTSSAILIDALDNKIIEEIGFFRGMIPLNW